MTEKQELKDKDGVVVFDIREEEGRFVFTFTREFSRRVTQEEWQRMRKHIWEGLDYPR